MATQQAGRLIGSNSDSAVVVVNSLLHGDDIVVRLGLRAPISRRKRDVRPCLTGRRERIVTSEGPIEEPNRSATQEVSMERSTRQLVAGGLVTATVIPYLGYAIGGEMPFIQDARGMAITGLALGAAAWLILGARAFGARWLGVGGAVAAVALGIIAAVLETGTASSVFLGAFVAVIVALYLVSLYEYLRHTGRTHPGLTPRHT